MYELDYSVCKNYSYAVDFLFKSLCKDILKYRRKNRFSRGDLQSIKEAIQCFLKNCKNSKGDTVSITLDKQSYLGDYIVNGRPTSRKVSYTFTKDLVNFLYNEGYIDMIIGEANFSYNFISKTYKLEESFPTLIIFKQPLINLLDTIKVKPSPRHNVVFLKDSEGKFTGFRLKDETIIEKVFIQKFNTYSTTKVVECNGHLYDVQSYKIFNIKQEFGGRTYMGGSIQNLSSDERAKITIDGNKTCRYDYKAFEPSIAYSLKKQIMQGDPYLLEGFDRYDREVIRKVIKRAMLVMLNADSKQSVAYSMNTFIKEEFDVKDLFEKGLIPKPKIPVSEILTKLEAKHEIISDMFYNESWKVLQREGGKIIDSVVEYMMQNHDCLCLQVFDECIVDQKFEKFLVQAMIDSFSDITGMPENCKIEKEN